MDPKSQPAGIGVGDQAVTSSAPRASLAVWEKVAFGAWVVLALSLVERLSPQWGLESYYFYGWAVLPLVCFFFIERLRCAPSRDVPAGFPGILLLVAGCMLCVVARWLVLSNRDWRLVLWGYGFGVCAAGIGLLLLMGGKSWAKYFAVPLALTLLAIPWPSFVEASIVDNLTRIVVAVVAGVLKVIGLEPAVAGQFMRLDGVSIEIGDACSGIRSFQALLALALMLGEIHRLGAKWRFLLLGMATGIGFVMNTLRAFVLVLVARMPGGALERYHDLAGYLSVGLGFLLLILLADRIAPVSKLKPVQTAHAVGNPRAAVAALALVSCVLILPEIYYLVVHPARSGETKAPWRFKPAPLAARPGAASIDLAPHREMLRFDSGSGVTFPLSEKEGAIVYSFQWTHTEVGLFKALGHTPDFCMGCAGAPLATAVFVHQAAIPGGTTPLPLEVYRFHDPMSGRPVDVFRLLWNGRVMDSLRERSHAARFKRALEGVRNPSGDVWLLYVGIVGSPSWENTVQRAETVIADCLESAP